MSAPSGRNAELRLSETGGTTFSILNRGADNRFVVSEAGLDLLTVDTASNLGKVTTRGDLLLGGTTVPGPRAAKIQTSSGEAGLQVQADSGPASVSVTAGGSSDATVNVQAPAGPMRDSRSRTKTEPRDGSRWVGGDSGSPTPSTTCSLSPRTLGQRRSVGTSLWEAKPVEPDTPRCNPATALPPSTCSRARRRRRD